MDIFVEAGKKKVFVGAVEWPGWCRFGKDESTALEAFLSYRERFAKVFFNTHFGFQAPVSEMALNIVVIPQEKLYKPSSVVIEVNSKFAVM